MGGTLFVYLFFISYSFGETQSKGFTAVFAVTGCVHFSLTTVPLHPASLPHPQGVLFCSITCIIPSPTPKVCSSPQDPLSSFCPLLGIRVFWSDLSCNDYWISFSFMQVAVTLSWILLFTVLRTEVPRCWGEGTTPEKQWICRVGPSAPADSTNLHRWKTVERKKTNKQQN